MQRRTRRFLAFFAVVLASYALMNHYILFHARALAPGGGAPATGALLVLMAAYIAGRVLERVRSGAVSAVLVWIGSFWLGAMVYCFLLSAAWDLAWAAARLAGGAAWWDARIAPRSPAVALAAAAAVAALLALGYANARAPRLRRVAIAIDRPSPGPAALTIALASDLHLGTIICRRRLRRIVERINAAGADLVLLAGDVIDEDLGPVVDGNLGEELRRIACRCGVYAVNGNHEWIGGAERAVRYLEEHGITVLRDAAAEPLPGVVVIGREDRSAAWFGGGRRAPLEELVRGLPDGALRILLDHQPARLDEAARSGIDLQLSGHTHHGQMWPFACITRAVYEISRGYGRRGATQYYVSSGVGTWGPPVRIGTTPEIVLLHIDFRG